jgi:hypothetical protein
MDKKTKVRIGPSERRNHVALISVPLADPNPSTKQECANHLDDLRRHCVHPEVGVKPFRLSFARPDPRDRLPSLPAEDIKPGVVLRIRDPYSPGMRGVDTIKISLAPVRFAEAA